MAYNADIGRAFWYDFDHKTKYDVSFFNTAIKPSGAFSAQNAFADTRKAGTYPQQFIAPFTAKKQFWVKLADVQKSTITQRLGTSWADIQAAFEDFGQGTLVDGHPERQPDDAIHTM